jgi:hypothetical protein
MRSSAITSWLARPSPAYPLYQAVLLLFRLLYAGLPLITLTMWYSKHLRLVRRARQVAKTRQQQLLALKLEGIVALTLHSATQTLTVPIEVRTGRR